MQSLRWQTRPHVRVLTAAAHGTLQTFSRTIQPDRFGQALSPAIIVTKKQQYRHVAEAFPGLAQFFRAAGKSRDRQKRAKYAMAATELLQLLTTQQDSTREAAAHTAQLVELLLSCQGIPFQEQLLGPEPWLVLYTQGGPQLWKATFKAGKLINASNAASQELDPSRRTVVNKAEYWGNKLFVTASGTYEPLDATTTLPKAIQANISSGLIHVLGLDIPLPIQGTGRFDVVWLDDNIRVFKSGTAVSVQVRRGYLEERGVLHDC